jgi:DNA repair/transcription protein MET18/MMS19
MSTTHFPFEKIEEHFEKVWTALKRELLPGSDNAEITAAAFKAIESIVMAASKTNNSKSLEFVLNTIFVAILSELMDVNSRFFAKSVKLCFVCARTSKAANLYMANKLLPIMLQQLENIDDQADDNVTKLCTIFETLTEFFAISSKNDVLAEIDGQQMQAVQLKLAKPLQAVVAQQLPPKNANRLTLLRVSLECLSKICGVLGDDNRTLVYETLKLLLQSELFAIEVDGVLVVFAKNAPNEVMAMVVQPLIGSNAKNNKIFHALAQLLPLDTFTSTILEFLLKFIVAESDKDGRPLQSLALKNLKTVLEANNSGDFISELHKRYDLIDKLVTYVQSQKELDEDVLYEISQTMCVIIKVLTLDQQQAIVKTHLPKLNLQIVKDLYLATGILGYLDSSVPLEDHFEDLVTDLSTLSMRTDDEVVKRICQQLLCSLFNKMADSEKNKTILKKILGIFKEEIKKHKHQAVEGLAWIAKALLSRGHGEAAEVVEDVSIIYFFESCIRGARH